MEASYSPLVAVDNLWKRYEIPHEKRNTILDQVAGAFQMLEGERFTFEELWALRGISFKVNRGDSIGVIGENGSGKSTLLKIIARIIRPTKGTVSVNGKVAPILELGVGFQGEMSVIENVVMYASILGLSNDYARRRIDSILEFGDLIRFRDAKLKHLSSGMQMRLAFSVAMEADPEIYLVDEALSVGDMDFQRKCLAKFRDFKKEGKSLVLVSHSLSFVTEFCDSALLLQRGEVLATGSAREVVEKYTNLHTPAAK
jgi:lipopolysaccharide transport system ATP-binding protein